MNALSFKRKTALLLFFLPLMVSAQPVKIVTNHVGYEEGKFKQAIIVANQKLPVSNWQLIDPASGNQLANGVPTFSGPVDKWKNQLYWTIDFSSFQQPGTYQLRLSMNGNTVLSHPFVIGKNVLEKATLSDLTYYFKGQRATGLFEKADHKLLLKGRTTDTVDLHGGWYDASGDYGKHLSHLSFSGYFNPQQISLTAWSLFKSYEMLSKRTGTDFRQINRRVLDEALYGADYLVRAQVKDGSFYRSVSAPGPGKFAKDRVIQPESQAYTIKKSKDQSFHTGAVPTSDLRSFQSSYRSGSGLAIAALAIASTGDSSGDFSTSDYLKAAENAFAYLEKNNVSLTNDGKENIVDDYCALNAATELFKATHKAIYQQAADKRAASLLARLTNWSSYKNYWRSDDHDRPFFHPSDAGLPVVSLIYYYPIASPEIQQKIKNAVRASFEFELAVTKEVNNPFGYSRQLVQDTAGKRRTSFFFPHGSEAAPWWQGENARLGSMATAAKLASGLFREEKSFQDSLSDFAINQLNWILGLNPFDACMLQGTGYNNPAYGFFGTFEYTNAPGGIVNGITSGLENESDIEFNLSFSSTGKDYDWRWAEQWLPHAAWYLLAISVK
jgi:hypothetical protein